MQAKETLVSYVLLLFASAMFESTLAQESTVNCASGPCKNFGTCRGNYIGDTFLSYDCFCRNGFSGRNCEVRVFTSTVSTPTTYFTEQASTPSRTTDFDECASGPCENFYTCLTDQSGYYCVCNYPYTGQNCEIDTSTLSRTTDFDECASGPCENFYTCLTDQSGYYCVCNYPYAGQNCEIDLSGITTKSPKSSTSSATSYCSLHTPCQNGGSCTDDGKESDYQCKCHMGFEGKDCQYLAEQPEETKEIVLTDDSCERKVSVGIPQVKYMATLSCEEGTIRIKSVAYGSGTHWNAWIDQIGKMCDHQTQCNVAAKDDMLDDPFRRVYKRLIIVYECEMPPSLPDMI